ncbi:unnamed protein product [Plutella xylostella]|uniref:unspecific monooxygenase n=1 Tax=Plutella xylostella TaxID=51655 RepID=A0A8S4G1C3_PLUXY|nr:unnamed protein product [Plutella xylostella]
MLGFTRSSSQRVFLLAYALQSWSFGAVWLWWLWAGLTAAAVVHALCTYDHDYWSDQGVFSPPAWPLAGHILSVVTFQEQGGMCFKRIYDTYKDVKFLGTHQFFQRTLVIRDPSLIKRICVSDFQHFVDRGFYFNKQVDPLAGSVLFLRGREWRTLRAKISPIFSPNKLRGMLPLIENTANEFAEKVKALLNNTEDINNNNQKSAEATKVGKDDAKLVEDVNSAIVDSEKLVGGYTADAIVPCAFGLKSNVMENDKDPFAVALQAFYEMSVYNVFEKTMRQFWPAFVLFFRMRIIPRRTHDFFYNIVTSVLRARETGEQEKRGDFIDMMMALRSDDADNARGSDDDDDVEISEYSINLTLVLLHVPGAQEKRGDFIDMMMSTNAAAAMMMTMLRPVSILSY